MLDALDPKLSPHSISKESTDTNTRVQERVQAARIDNVGEEYEEHNAVLGQRCIRMWAVRQRSKRFGKLRTYGLALRHTALCSARA